MWSYLTTSSLTAGMIEPFMPWKFNAPNLGLLNIWGHAITEFISHVLRMGIWFRTKDHGSVCKLLIAFPLNSILTDISGANGVIVHHPSVDEMTLKCGSVFVMFTEIWCYGIFWFWDPKLTRNIIYDSFKGLRFIKRVATLIRSNQDVSLFYT